MRVYTPYVISGVEVALLLAVAKQAPNLSGGTFTTQN